MLSAIASRWSIVLVRAAFRPTRTPERPKILQRVAVEAQESRFEATMSNFPSLASLQVGALVSRKDPMSVPILSEDITDGIEEVLDQKSFEMVAGVLDEIAGDVVRIDSRLQDSGGEGYKDYKSRVDIAPLDMPWTGRVAATVEIVVEPADTFNITTAMLVNHFTHTTPASTSETLDLAWAKEEETKSAIVQAREDKRAFGNRRFIDLTDEERKDADGVLYDIYIGEETPMPKSMKILQELGFGAFKGNINLFDFDRPLTRLGEWIRDYMKKDPTAMKTRRFYGASTIQLAAIAIELQRQVRQLLQDVFYKPGGPGASMRQTSFDTLKGVKRQRN